MSWKPFNDYAKRYDGWFDRNRAAYLSEVGVLKKVVPSGGRGLEIGVGTGRFASVFDVSIGIDPSMNVLRIARTRGVAVVLGCGERLPFKRREFDWVLMNTTLCFLRSPEGTLTEAHRVIRENGRIIVGIIDRESDLGRRYRLKPGTFYGSARFHSTQEVIRLLRASGFRAFHFYQTIFPSPDRRGMIEQAKEGYGEGSFVAVSGEKE